MTEEERAAVLGPFLADYGDRIYQAQCVSTWDEFIALMGTPTCCNTLTVNTDEGHVDLMYAYLRPGGHEVEIMVGASPHGGWSAAYRPIRSNWDDLLNDGIYTLYDHTKHRPVDP